VVVADRPAALVGYRDAVAWPLGQRDGGQLVGVGSRLIIQLGDDVARAQTGTGGWAAGQDTRQV
jgi:hypothetical protein